MSKIRTKEQRDQVFKKAGVKVETKDPGELIPYARNTKKHTDIQISQIAASIKEFGFIDPIIVDENKQIIAGHGRWQAAMKLGLTEVPTVSIDHLSDTQKRALSITHNQLTLSTGFDDELLSLELLDLKAEEFDLSLLGFDDSELNKLLKEAAAAGLTDDDEVPQPPGESITQPGDVWTLGKHRLACGSSSDPNIMDALMQGQKADLIFTDPPYGVSFEQGKFVGRDKAANKFQGKKIANDELRGDDLKDFLKSVFGLAHIYTKGCSIYCFAPSLLEGGTVLKSLLEGGTVLKSLLESSWQIQSQIIWKKTPFVIGRGDYHWQHEGIWYGYKKDSGHGWYGGRDKGTVWEVPKITKVEFHPTQKPVELAEIALNNSTKPEDLVLDLFAGSGTTLIACEKLNRAARCVELDPIWVDTIIKRWENFTGQKAVKDEKKEART